MKETGETRRVFRLFLPWKDQEEQRWLERMAREGWHLAESGIRYGFLRGEPREVHYRVDYRATEELDRGEYLGLFRDGGWEHVCDFGPWHYFRADAAAVVNDVYTDTDSLLGKFRRQVRALLFLALINLGGLANNLMPDHFHTDLIGLSGIVFPIIGALCCGYLVIGLSARIGQIKRSAS